MDDASHQQTQFISLVSLGVLRQFYLQILICFVFAFMVPLCVGWPLYVGRFPLFPPAFTGRCRRFASDSPQRYFSSAPSYKIAKSQHGVLGSKAFRNVGYIQDLKIY